MNFYKISSIITRIFSWRNKHITFIIFIFFIFILPFYDKFIMLKLYIFPRFSNIFLFRHFLYYIFSFFCI